MISKGREFESLRGQSILEYIFFLHFLMLVIVWECGFLEKMAWGNKRAETDKAGLQTTTLESAGTEALFRML